ncbi:translation elongation factor Ts [Candidatus Omnitrophota bacterium]
MGKTVKIDAKQIQKLREQTNAGVMDCKQALEKASGDFTQAVQFLREKGIALAAKKAHRQVREGRITAYVHSNHKIGVLVEVNCETDFVSRCAEFQQFSKDVAMQIAALNPTYLKKEDVPKDVAKEQKARLEDFYKQSCLMEQSFVKDQSKSISDYLAEIVGKIGENILISRFTRFELGATLGNEAKK